MATVSLRDEVTELLQELIRIDTTNPPGNETAAAEVLQAYLEDSGAEVELYARIPERANLVARIPGRGDGPTLLFLSHTDVVLADAAEWTADPFGGERRQRAGQIEGRRQQRQDPLEGRQIPGLLRLPRQRLCHAGNAQRGGSREQRVSEQQSNSNAV